MSNFTGMIGSRHECQCCGRKLTIVGIEEGHGPDDPDGYSYVFDKEPGLRWISTSAANVRFKPSKPVPADNWNNGAD